MNFRVHGSCRVGADPRVTPIQSNDGSGRVCVSLFLITDKPFSRSAGDNQGSVAIPAVWFGPPDRQMAQAKKGDMLVIADAILDENVYRDAQQQEHKNLQLQLRDAMVIPKNQNGQANGQHNGQGQPQSAPQQNAYPPTAAPAPAAQPAPPAPPVAAAPYAVPQTHAAAPYAPPAQSAPPPPAPNTPVFAPPAAPAQPQQAAFSAPSGNRLPPPPQS